MAGVYIITAVGCFVVGGIQVDRAINATSISSDFEELTNIEDAYDFCVGDGRSAVSSSTLDLLTGGGIFGNEGTGWTLVWQLNASIMIIMGVNYLLMAVGAFKFKFRLGSTISNYVLAILNSIGALMAYQSFSGLGAVCVLSTQVVEYEGDGKWASGGRTYAEDGASIFLFAVIQTIIGVTQIVYCGCPLIFTKVLPDDDTP